MNPNPPYAVPPPQPPRPFGVTLLALGVLTIAGLSLLRLILAVQDWSFLLTLQSAVQASASPLYLALSGFIWAATGLLLFWGLWRGASPAGRAVSPWAIVYALYVWLDRFFIANRAVTLVNWPFTAAITIFLLGYTFWIINRRSSRAFFNLLS